MHIFYDLWTGKAERTLSSLQNKTGRSSSRKKIIDPALLRSCRQTVPQIYPCVEEKYRRTSLIYTKPTILPSWHLCTYLRRYEVYHTFSDFTRIPSLVAVIARVGAPKARFLAILTTQNNREAQHLLHEQLS